MAFTSRPAIGSPYPSSPSCATRAFGRAPRPLKASASSTRKRARQSRDLRIRVTSSHSGVRSDMLGEPTPSTKPPLPQIPVTSPLFLPHYHSVLSPQDRRKAGRVWRKTAMQLAPPQSSSPSQPLANATHDISSPARFYVSVVMKMILSHLIVDYEFKLADPTARPYLTFGKTRLPNPFTAILVRKRRSDSGGTAVAEG
jgi:hypothetical protein